MDLFTLLGALIGLYVLHCSIKGEVHAKDGIRMRTVYRTESPRYFWVVIGIYAALSLALLTIL